MHQDACYSFYSRDIGQFIMQQRMPLTYKQQSVLRAPPSETSPEHEFGPIIHTPTLLQPLGLTINL